MVQGGFANQQRVSGGAKIPVVSQESETRKRSQSLVGGWTNSGIIHCGPLIPSSNGPCPRRPQTTMDGRYSQGYAIGAHNAVVAVSRCDEPDWPMPPSDSQGPRRQSLPGTGPCESLNPKSSNPYRAAQENESAGLVLGGGLGR